MKKLLLTTSLIAVFAAFAGKANAECDGIYAALRGGVVQHDIKKIQGDLDKNRLMLAGALGYRWEYLRAELEYVWRKYATDTKVSDEERFLKTYSFMLNAYYDVLPYNWWTPYIGAGIGISRVTFYDRDLAAGFMNQSWKTRKFTWSLGGGLSLKVTNRFNVDLGYRYYDFNNPHNSDASAQEVYGGIRYVF
ncbi:MAG: porin family protein [Alphaproteobacteria bacterium]|nr:porin family protein [Alphaproteobacteria bacterium]